MCFSWQSSVLNLANPFIYDTRKERTATPFSKNFLIKRNDIRNKQNK